MACVLLRRIMGTGGQIVVAPRYNASTGVTFYFNATPVDFNTAEASCAAAGGHVAGYSSRAEQVRAACYKLLAPRCARCTAPASSQWRAHVPLVLADTRCDSHMISVPPAV
jgi:hypothetical protein